MRCFSEKLFVLLASATLCVSALAAEITGAGATFPYPLYAKWASLYQKESGHKLNYQSIGSGGGIKQIKAGTVDFGASDMPLKSADLSASGLVQFPAILGGVVPIVNLEGIKSGELRLSGAVIADIYLGKINKWNAREIVALNPGIRLPDLAITVVHRADSSGSSFLWTDFLSKVSPAFKTQVGAGTTVKWPTGVGGKGNEGVAANVGRIGGAIGYVEYAYAKKGGIAHAQLQNKTGRFVQPNRDSFMAAAAGAPWSSTPGFGVVLTNGKGWPITGASFILMKTVQADSAKGKEVLRFFDWSFKNGAAAAEELDYVMLPKSVLDQVRQVWRANIKGSSGKSVWQ